MPDATEIVTLPDPNSPVFQVYLKCFEIAAGRYNDPDKIALFAQELADAFWRRFMGCLPYEIPVSDGSRRRG